MRKFDKTLAIQNARLRIESGAFLETIRLEKENTEAFIYFLKNKRKFSTNKLNRKIG